MDESRAWGFYEWDVNGKIAENKYEPWRSEIENAAAARDQGLVNRQRLTKREMVAWAPSPPDLE